MTLTHPRQAVLAPAPERANRGRTTQRDRAVDLVRAGCLIAVVSVHALMVGVSVAGGSPVLENALEPWAGFTAFSWIAQMMPLFFIAGGFAAATHYRRVRATGVSDAAYVASRLGRLLPVPLLAAAATLLVLGALAVAGVDGETIATAGWRISQPLWFLGVYVLCSALVPTLLRFHERSPGMTLAVLGAGILTVDALRLASGIDAIGFANLVLVWLFVQQLGFLLADGRAPGPRTAAAALVLAGLLIAIGASPANLYEALNPPTAVLALLGVVQCALFQALRPRIERLANVRAIRTASDAINARSMTIYSWHMPATVLLAGALLMSGIHLPTPLTADWWASRPLWLAAVCAVVALVVAGATRLERRVTARITTAAAPSPLRVSLAVLAASGGVLVILAATGTPAAWACGAALMAAALLGCRGLGSKA